MELNEKYMFQVELKNTNIKFTPPKFSTKNFINQDVKMMEKDFNEDIDKIYLEIQRNHSGLFETLYSYGVPKPITREIVERLIKYIMEN